MTPPYEKSQIMGVGAGHCPARSPPMKGFPDHTYNFIDHPFGQPGIPMSGFYRQIRNKPTVGTLTAGS